MNKIIFFLLLILPTQLFSQEKVEPISPCVSELFVANSFSGNGDGVNDIFIPKLIGEPYTYEFIIYNRWAEVIFKTDKVTEGWNGTYKNQAQPSDVYVWMLKFTCKDSEEKYSYSGNVTLIR
jgi:gliding motility-associated-like protein